MKKNIGARLLIPATLAFIAGLLALLSVSEPARNASAANGDSNIPAQVTDSGYAQDNNFQAFRSSIAVADTQTTTNVLALPALQVQGRTTLMLGARFSNASATVGVCIAWVWRHPYASSDTDVTTRTMPWKTIAFQQMGTSGNYTPVWTSSSVSTIASNQIKGYSPTFTLAAGTQQWEGSYYTPAAGDYQIDTGRAVTVRLVVTTAPSAGTVTFRLGS